VASQWAQEDDDVVDAPGAATTAARSIAAMIGPGRFRAAVSSSLTATIRRSASAAAACGTGVTGVQQVEQPLAKAMVSRHAGRRA
jgi:hypothetical protein